MPASGGGDRIAQQNIQDWDQVLAVNLRGPFLLCRAVLPQMQRRKDGHIINISSESAMEHYTGDGVYGVAKHALNALSEYIQRENQDYNIRVDTVCPGMVVTEMTENSPGLDHEKCLYPEDIADLVVWLISRRKNIKIGTPILIQTMLNPLGVNDLKTKEAGKNPPPGYYVVFSILWAPEFLVLTTVSVELTAFGASTAVECILIPASADGDIFSLHLSAERSHKCSGPAIPAPWCHWPSL